MIALARHQDIAHHIAKVGSATVSELARIFEVTEETIRRDLRKLSVQGLLIRTHGGAVAADRDEGLIDHPFKLRQTERAAEKAAIATAAAALVEPGQVIALDASSTACELARRLPDQPLTVVTNSMPICSILAGRREVEVVCAGGILDADAMAFFGLHATRTIESFNIDRFFFSCRGIDLRRGLSEANDRHAAVKLSTIQASQQRILMADTSKLGLASAVFFAPAQTADRLITEESDDPAHRKNLDQLRKRNVVVDEVALKP